MVILLTGASGFLGQHLLRGLTQVGHRVVPVYRNVAPGSGAVAADFARDVNPEVWLPRLVGIDVVINAVGILRERGPQTFEAIHARAPQALFRACTVAGVSRVLQVSALGADTGRTRYFTSKHAADEFLTSLPLNWTIVQPSLVYGPGGTSAALFTSLAGLPLVPVPGGGHQQVQPIHIDDLVASMTAMVERRDVNQRRVPLVGPRVLTFRELLDQLRQAMGLGRARFVSIPMWMMQGAARIAELSPRSLLDRETLDMLEAGNTASAEWTQRLLQRPPRDAATFVESGYRKSLRQDALLQWLLPLLRFSIAVVWIWTGIVSVGLYPREESLQLLARTGVPEVLAPLLLYGAAGLDLAFGFATLLLRRRRLLWLSQMALILLYSAIITVKLPEFWLHPYGPMVKNLPMLAALYLLYVLETPAWNTSS
jgi:uncharacterized protein YbjT (DUF2867 family)